MALLTVRRQIIGCEGCPRLRAYCARIAQDKRAAFRDDVYWGRPVPGFGDRRKAMLEDIATLTGGKAITEDLGL